MLICSNSCLLFKKDRVIDPFGDAHGIIVCIQYSSHPPENANYFIILLYTTHLARDIPRVHLFLAQPPITGDVNRPSHGAWKHGGVGIMVLMDHSIQWRKKDKLLCQ